MNELDLAMFDGLHVTKIERIIRQTWRDGYGPQTQEAIDVRFDNDIASLNLREWDARFNAAGYDVAEWRSEGPYGRQTVTLKKVTK